MVADDPVHGSEMFHTVIEAFLKAFLGFNEGNGDGELHRPLLNKTIFTGNEGGGLNAYFGTVECQNRGSLHLHMLVWLAGLPSAKEIVSRINAALALARATAGHPEGSSDTTSLVNDVQVGCTLLQPCEANPSPARMLVSQKLVLLSPVLLLTADLFVRLWWIRNMSVNISM